MADAPRAGPPPPRLLKRLEGVLKRALARMLAHQAFEPRRFAHPRQYRREPVEPRFGAWSVGKIDHESIQKWVNELAQSGLSPRTLRWIHSGVEDVP